MRYLAKVSYDGTNFCGWQIQKNGRTIQAEIEKAISQISKQNTPIVGAGRTDAGVHAYGQYFHFDLTNKMTTDQIRLAIQTKLDHDIKICQVYKVKEDFHARYKAVRRSYKYIISKEITPFNRFYKTHFFNLKLNVIKVNECINYFMGNHDFTSFSKFNPEIKSTRCNVKEIKFEEIGTDYVFMISANRFLHNMVRRIVGTIINIVKSEYEPKIISDLIAAKTTENKIITTAPATGLYLFEVEYPKEYFI